jgi:hypothetical protein
MAALAADADSAAPPAPAAGDARRASFGETGFVQTHKIVLTGGPCAGKTSAMSRVGDFLRLVVNINLKEIGSTLPKPFTLPTFPRLRLSPIRQRGFRVFTVPEAATLFWSNGAAFHVGFVQQQTCVWDLAWRRLTQCASHLLNPTPAGS